MAVTDLQPDFLEAQQALAARNAALYYTATARPSCAPPSNATPSSAYIGGLSSRAQPRARLMSLLHDTSSKRIRQREAALRRAFAAAPNVNSSSPGANTNIIEFSSGIILHVNSNHFDASFGRALAVAENGVDDDFEDVLGELPRDCVDVQLEGVEDSTSVPSVVSGHHRLPAAVGMIPLAMAHGASMGRSDSSGSSGSHQTSPLLSHALAV